MNNPKKCVEIYTTQGALIFKVIISDFIEPENNKSDAKPNTTPKTDKTNGNQNGESITQAQKKYLFRLMATTHGLSGEEANTELKNLLGVNSLQEVSKSQASKMIEQLIEEERGGNGHGSSVK